MEFIQNLENIRKAKFEKIGNLVNFSNQTYDFKNPYNEFCYIEISSINLHKGEIENTSNLLEKDAPSRAKLLVKNGDILVSATRPSRGAIAQVTENFNGAVASTGFIIIAQTSPKILKAYLWNILRTKSVLLQMEQRSTGGNYPAITQDDFKEILIPLPPLEIQKQIIAKMDEAYRVKKQKESEAKELLDSIDEYLLNELGINYSSLRESETNEAIQTKKPQFFIKSFNELSGSRFDSEYYQTHYQNLETALEDGKYESIELGKILSFVASGSTPEAKGNDYEQNGKYYFLRLVNFDKNLNINLSDCNFVKEHIYKGMLARVQVIKGDILFGIAGSIGKVAQFTHNYPAVINQAIAILRFKDNVFNDYMLYILNSQIIKIQTERLKRPVAQPNINITELKSLKIPLPPLEVQNQIADEIQKRKNKALNLQKQAKQILEEAKSEVQNLILS